MKKDEISLLRVFGRGGYFRRLETLKCFRGRMAGACEASDPGVGAVDVTG